MTELEVQKQKTLGIQVQTYGECMQFAEAVSNSDMVPKSYKSNGQSKEQVKAALFVAIAMGQELGLTPMASIQSIAVVNGMPTIWGDSMLGIVRASGKLKSIREWDDGEWEKGSYVAYCETWRVGDDSPVTTSFSYADAKRANLVEKSGTWKSHPKRMMKYKARSFNLRDQFADVLKGIHSQEEMEGEAIEVAGKTVQKSTSFFDEAKPKQIEAPAVDLEVLRATIDDFTLEDFETKAKEFFAELKPKLSEDDFIDLRFYGVERMRGLKEEQGQNDEQTSLPTE